MHANLELRTQAWRVAKCAAGRLTGMVLMATGLTVPAAGAGEPRGTVLTETFEASGEWALPAGWSSVPTGKGTPRWSVVRDDTAPSGAKVLRQDGVADFALCLKTNQVLATGFIEVKFKPLSGEKDQAGGLVWRVQDSNNYYVVRANALETNVVPYKVVNGKRTALNLVGRPPGYGVTLPVPQAAWSTLRVEFAGTRHRVCFNGQPCFEVEDATFTGPGQVGVWTKADSVTVFDDFVAGETRR
jgi:hypothetical protein